MKGSCFCGDVTFEVEIDKQELYQCHCSMCRKVTGSSANAAFLIDRAKFQWISSSEKVTSYSKPTGYRVDFCSTCGSTVPNLFKETRYWVPAGLLEEDSGLTITSHICVGSKADWDEIGGDAQRHSGVPEN